MKKYAFVDSNVFIQLLYGGVQASKAEELLNRYPLLATSIGVIDEVLHFIIRKEAMKKHGIRRTYDLRKLVRNTGIDFAIESLKKFVSLLEELHVRVMVDTETQPRQIIATMANYRLSPRDAIIALTCKHHGIDTILTFDKDFKYVPWLNAIP